MKISFLVILLTVQWLMFVCVSQNFDFYYLVEQWPGSYCDPKKSCCHPTAAGKLPTDDFKIHGLWPTFNNGSNPTFCDSHNRFNQTKILDLIPLMKQHWPSLVCPGTTATTFWAHEWNKHGTCSQSILSQHQYFEAALLLKKKSNFFKTLAKNRIKPDGQSYDLSRIIAVLTRATSVRPWIQCNIDASGKSQLYQIFTCVDTSGKNFVNCPVIPPGGKCGSSIWFPSII